MKQTRDDSISAAPQKGLLHRQISWRWPLGLLALLLLATATLWIIGLNSPVPQFRLAPNASGKVTPVDWPWWRRAADWLHGRRYLMLTFDDGPADHATDTRILNILARHHAHAAFFTICRNADRPGGAADLRADLKAGDVIGDHTYTHPHLPTLAARPLWHQIRGCQLRLQQITGSPVRWFRPPFGQTSPAVLTDLRKAGMHQVMWTDNSEDSWLTTPKDIEHWSTDQAGNDAILLMHSRATTAAALDKTLTLLEKGGYVFVLPQQ